MLIAEFLCSLLASVSQAVHVYHVEPTPLQRLALTFADKATQFGRHNVNLLNGTTDGNFEVRKGDRRYNNRRNWGRNNNNRGGRGTGTGMVLELVCWWQW